MKQFMPQSISKTVEQSMSQKLVILNSWVREREKESDHCHPRVTVDKPHAVTPEEKYKKFLTIGCNRPK